MYDINIKNIKKGKTFYRIFLIVGLFFLIILSAIFISDIIKINKLNATTLSTKIEMRSYSDDGITMYSPIYYYIVDDIEYKCYSYKSSNISIDNQNKKIYYNPKKPSECMSSYSKGIDFTIILSIIIPITCIVIGVSGIKKINRRIKIILELNKKGTIIRRLPFRLEDTRISINNVILQRFVVDYTLKDGSTITLYGDPIYNRKLIGTNDYVDLLIDERNPDNYYIDFEIK